MTSEITKICCPVCCMSGKETHLRKEGSKGMTLYYCPLNPAISHFKKFAETPEELDRYIILTYNHKGC